MSDKRPQYRVTLINRDLATRSQSTISAYCFAEAASQAYLLKNNRNQAQGEGWWKIHSISETNELARQYEPETENKNEKNGWGWSSEGEMT